MFNIDAILGSAEIELFPIGVVNKMYYFEMGIFHYWKQKDKEEYYLEFLDECFGD